MYMSGEPKKSHIKHWLKRNDALLFINKTEFRLCYKEADNFYDKFCDLYQSGNQLIGSNWL